MKRDFLYKHDRWLVGLLLAVIAVTLVALRPESGVRYSAEAEHRVMVARDMTAHSGDQSLDQSRGNQALVGSLLFAPLPTILLALAGLLPGVHVTTALAGALSGVTFSLFCAYVYHYWRRHGVSAALALPGAAALLLFPPVVYSIWQGTTALLFIALVVAAIVALVEWTRTGLLHDLAYASVFFGLASITRYQGLFIALAGLVFVVLTCAARSRRYTRIEGTAVTYLLPIGYAIALWIGGNWLVLGRPFFFLTWTFTALRTGLAEGGTILRWDCPWALVGALAAFVLVIPVARALVPSSWSRQAQQAAAALALACLIIAAFVMPRPVPAAPPESAGIGKAVATLQERYPNTVFVVTGYAGYTFRQAAGADPEQRWIHRMRLDPDSVARVVHDYPGRNIALLVDSSNRNERWMDAELAWLSRDSHIPDRFLYRDQVGRWTVFEVLTPALPE
jgi:hypothetical protein